MAIEYGTVKFFRGGHSRLWGFITGDDGADYFFHFNNGDIYKVSEGGTQFSVNLNKLRAPRKGDRLAFEPLPTPRAKGPSVSVWYYADDYDRAKEAVRRPISTVTTERH